MSLKSSLDNLEKTWNEYKDFSEEALFVHHNDIEVCIRSFKAGKDAGFREGVAYAKALLGSYD